MTELKLDYHSGDNIVDLFRSQIDQHGTNTAVSFQDRSITYQQLGEKSVALALYLQQQGVCVDGCVGLFVDPSIELMVGVWGILQSGSAYLPLAPEYPDDRLKYMLENSQCKIIVVQDELVERLATLILDDVVLITFSQVTHFFITKQTPQFYMLTQHATADNLAYVIYTSGSTGKPKGVMIEHKSIANQMDWLSTHFSLDSNSVVLQKTPMSFDAAQWEILASCCGARVVMGEPGVYKNPEKLVDTIMHHDVSMLQGVPTLLLALLNVEKFTQCTSLTQIFSGGEALSKHLANELSEQLPHSSIINLYGPTECTINSSAHIVDIKETQDSADTISIGKPIQNTLYYILDKDKKPVVVGDIGELYIAGVGLARGYLHRDDLTADRFISHFFDDQDISQRLYKTGDLAYWNEKGSVQYSGRVDNQVKLRGYRVELDEIKSIIESHDWVNNAAVFLKKDQYTGYQNLVSMIELNPREAALMDQGNHDPHHQSKQSRSQVKMQLTNTGCRQDAEIVNKSIIDLPGKTATEKQRKLVFSRKSYRFFEGGKITKADILNVLNSKVNYDHYAQLSDLNYADFGSILRYFGQFHSENRLLPKYGYASPGALYATQMYLELSGIGNLTPGYYYYHPVHHQLVLLAEKEVAEKETAHNENSSSVQFKVHFVGKKSAIEPIYKNNILEVLEMEVGHMVGFFENILPNYGLSIKSSDYVPSTMALFEVEENDYYLGSFNIVSGTKDVMNDDVSLYLQSHPGQVSGLKAGKYLYENGALEYVSSEMILKKHVIAINQSVYERASFGISVLSTTDEHWLGYINLGRKLQSLQMNDFNIGFMSSGYSSKTGNNLPSAKQIQHILNKDVGPSYFFIGGLISDEQILSDGMNEDVVHMKGPSEIIQDDLVKFLPTYMMPNTIKVIDKMPLTVNGKIDIKALLTVETDCIREEHIEPANDVERVVLDIWKKGLNRDSISVNTDFFELGGNSLIAVSVINKINTTLSCDLPLQIIFSSPTIQKLAQAVNQKEDDSASRLVPFQVKGKGSPIYCWPGLGGYCMNLRLLSEKLGTDRAFFGVQAYGINVGETPYQTISEMAAKDIAMIKQNQGEGPYTLWGYSFGARVAFEACYQLEQAGDVVENLYLIAPGSPKVAVGDNRTENSEATFTNKKFLTILYSVFMGTIKSNSLIECLSVVDTKDKFIHFICGFNNQLETGLVMRIIDIVTMTFEFTYSFHELKQRQLKAPIKIIKATGDDYSFIENNNVFSITEPVIEKIAANHYTMLKTTHIDQLVAVL